VKKKYSTVEKYRTDSTGTSTVEQEGFSFPTVDPTTARRASLHYWAAPRS
jgi:hypothetical protein